MVNVIYHVSSLEDWIDIALNMEEEHGWIPRYWISAGQREVVNTHFPSAIYQNRYSASKGRVPEEYNGPTKYALDKDILSENLFHQAISAKMMDRMDPYKSFTYDERYRLYRDLLMYWLNVIEQYEIDIIIFSTGPHHTSDYTLYTAAKHLGVKTIIFTPTSLPGVEYSQENIYEGSNRVKSELEDSCGRDIPDRLNSYLEGIRSDENITPDHVIEEREKSIKPDVLENLSTIQKTLSRPLRAYERMVKILDGGGGNRYKEKRGRIEDSNLDGAVLKYLKYKGMIKKKVLEKSYEKHSTKPDYNQDYIYFPMHYQPERTTCPEGGLYVDQFLVANLLNTNLPDGWVIYCKEHPSQFLPNLQGELGREKYHYRDLSELENVQLIDHNESSRKLIDNANATATVTGTAGWESVVRSTPSIVFGNAWYRSCEGVFHVKTDDELSHCIEKIEQGHSIAENQVERFVHSVVSAGFFGYTSRSSTNPGWIPSEENVRSITNHLAKFE